MSRLAVHLVWGCYGFWLPNDPRGSWSKYVGSDAIFEAGGRATTVSTTRSLAARTHDRQKRIAAKRAMQDAPVRLSGVAARDSASGIAAACVDVRFTLFTLCVMPDHVHTVIDNHGEDALITIRRLKAGATRSMNTRGTAPREGATPWVRGGWFVGLNDAAAVRRAIRYVNANPIRAGLRPQRWSFVKPFPTDER